MKLSSNEFKSLPNEVQITLNQFSVFQNNIEENYMGRYASRALFSEKYVHLLRKTNTSLNKNKLLKSVFQVASQDQLFKTLIRE